MSIAICLPLMIRRRSRPSFFLSPQANYRWSAISVVCYYLYRANINERICYFFSYKCSCFRYDIPWVWQRKEIAVNATKTLQALGTFPVDYTKTITTAGHYLTTGSVVSQNGEKVSCSGAAVVVWKSFLCWKKKIVISLNLSIEMCKKVAVASAILRDK